VLWNLIHNAIKFTPAQGRVEINVSRVDGEMQIAVVDNGQGIAPSFLPHVFERFRQQDASSTRATFGLGLGLSIAKQLVELHGGTISAHSEGEGCGATFIVRLPAVPHNSLATTPVGLESLDFRPLALGQK
jgi:signal transduction histidine kinase